VHIDFYYDFVSPYSYFASVMVAELAGAHGVALNWAPVRLTRLLELTGNVSPVTVPKKARYMLRDLGRWSRRIGVPFRMQHPPFFETGPALLAALAREGEERRRFSQAVFRALWTGTVRVGDSGDWLTPAIAAASLPRQWAQAGATPALREALERNTGQASRDGAFGVPTFVLRAGGRRELFFGVDRIDFLADALGAAQPSRAAAPGRPAAHK
jgi:glutathione S-transferase kappa 1